MCWEVTSCLKNCKQTSVNVSLIFQITENGHTPAPIVNFELKNLSNNMDYDMNDLEADYLQQPNQYLDDEDLQNMYPMY